MQANVPRRNSVSRWSNYWKSTRFSGQESAMLSHGKALRDPDEAGVPGGQERRIEGPVHDSGPSNCGDDSRELELLLARLLVRILLADRES